MIVVFRPVDKPESEQKNGDPGYLGNNISNLIIGNALPLYVVSQADLAKAWMFGLDGFKEAAATLGSFPLNPIPENLHRS
jgi:hypothetical protein